MSGVVVDASVAVKWFLPEVHSDAARRILSGKRKLLAPDLIWVEVGNVLWKKSRRAEITYETARGILRDFRRFPLQNYAVKSLLEPAWDLAERFRISVYDSVYLALAVSRNCTLVTADQQFFNAVKGTPVESSMAWVESIR